MSKSLQAKPNTGSTRKRRAHDAQHVRHLRISLLLQRAGQTPWGAEISGSLGARTQMIGDIALRRGRR